MNLVPSPSPSAPHPGTDAGAGVSSAPTGAPPASPAAPPPPDVARTAGRGGLAISFAKLYFIAFGLVQQVLLPRVLGLGGYGALSSVLSVASMAYNPIVTTSIQGVSRAVAGSAEVDRPPTIRRVLGVHALLALPLAGAFLAAAPALGAWMGAPHLVGGLRLLAGVLLVYGLYAPLVGVLNGQQRFVAQAGLDILSATLRTGGLVAGGALAATLGVGAVEGASLGFIVAASAVLLLAAVLVSKTLRPRDGASPSGSDARPAPDASAGGTSVRAHLGFIGPLVLGQVLLNLLLQADLTLLRKFSAEAALAAGLDAHAADPLVGAYRATQLFSFLPYQLLIAVTFILFPLLATAHRDGDRASVALYVRTGMRLALVLMGAMVTVTAGLSGPLLRLVFGAEAAALGTDAMRWLTLGFGAFALFGVLVTVLNSLHRERQSTVVTGLAFALVAVLGFALVRGQPFGGEILLRTAMATVTALALATAVAAFLVYRAAGAVVAPLTVVRVVGALAATVTVGRLLPPPGKLVTLLEAAALPALYLVLLVLTGELGRSDVEMVRRVVKRKR